MSPRTAVLLSSLSLLAVAPGCSMIVNAISGASKKATRVNMNNWNVDTMKVALRDDKTSLCPGETVQLVVSAKLSHKKKDKHKTVQTPDGNASVKNVGTLGFDNFTFSSEQGSFGERGFFTASPDILGTAIDGFAINTVYTPQPDPHTFDNRYIPNYDCITHAGASGPGGRSGSSGSMGSSGASGSSGSSEKAGENGGAGGPAGDGTDGGDGGPGPTIIAYATIVKTPHHDHLVMLKVTGDHNDVLLFDTQKPITLSASGGPGGSGGSGGSGGRGGSGGSGYPGGNGGAGGAGGRGANGGNGGPGGQLVFIYDEAYPELANVVMLNASGGPGGYGGSAGNGGDGGSYGSGNGEGAPDGAKGAEGPDGIAGQSGQSGPDGVAQAQAANVDEFFTDLPEGIERI